MSSGFILAEQGNPFVCATDPKENCSVGATVVGSPCAFFLAQLL